MYMYLFVFPVAVANKKIIEEYSKSLQAAGLTVSRTRGRGNLT